MNIDDIPALVVGLETHVPVLDGGSVPYINLDNAASTPVLKPVLDKLNVFMGWYSSVHRGTGFKSQIATHIYDQVHDVALDFVGGDPVRDTVILVRNTTEAINRLARRFTYGDRVVLCSKMEHHSNDLPWRANVHVEYIELKSDGSIDLQDLRAKLDRSSGHVDLVAITGGSNVTGIINPIHEIAELAHAAGAKIMVDAAQLAPHRRIDMLSHDDPRHLDFVTLSGHKLYAPYGVGALIGSRKTFEEGAPDLVGGGSVDIVTLSSVQWTSLPDKEEAGSPNVVGGVAMAESMLLLNELGMDTVAAHEAELTAYALEGLAQIPRIRVFGPTDPQRATERLGVISFQVEGLSHFLVAAILSAEFGIGVRNGCFCAHPYVLELLGLDEQDAAYHRNEIKRGSRTNLPGLVRISFGIYNTRAEIARLLEALAVIAQDRYQGVYEQDPASGSYAPQGHVVDLDDYFRLGVPKSFA
ncbi:MAG: aminotransferase class V-fold PLP-dependent enzyme [Anaerolineae bacterium]|nr:aminotransferase class V-fold PLP-dependent enzyme [Anaerolineae bacterium]